MTPENLHDALNQLPNDLVEETDKLRSSPKKTVIPWRQWVSMAACAVLILGCGFFLLDRWMISTSTTSECAAEAPEEALLANSFDGAAVEESAREAEERDMTEAAVNGSAALGDEQTHGSTESGLTPTGYPADGAYFIDLSDAQVCMTNELPNISICIDSSCVVFIQSRAELDAYCQEWADYCQLDSVTEDCEAFDDDWFAEYDLLLFRISTEKSELVPVIDSITLTGPESCEVTVSFAVFPEDRTPDPALWHILLPTEKGLLTDSTIINIECP